MKDHFQDLRTSILSQNKGELEGNITESDSIATMNTGTQNNERSVTSLKKTSSSNSLNGQLAQQLISRMRRVSRVSFVSPQPTANQRFLFKYLSPKKVFQEMKYCKQKESMNQIQDYLSNGYQQKTEQKASSNEAQLKIHQLTLTNENLRKKVNQLQQQLFVYKQQIEKMLQEINENRYFINQLQETIVHKDYQIAQLLNEVHHLRENKQKQIKEPKIRLSAQQVFNEIVTPYPSLISKALVKAKQQAASLRKRLKQTQRQRQKMMIELNQQKQQQIMHLKDHFAKNIQYYKNALIKLTTKQKFEIFRPKLSEQLQSAGFNQCSKQP